MLGFRKLVAVITLSATMACYTGVPLDSFPPPQGTDLTLVLTDAGARDLAAVVGPKVTGIQGRYLKQSGDSLYLGISAITQQGGNEQYWEGERVGVPRLSIATIRERQLSVGKSVLITLGVLAVLVGIRSIAALGNPGSNTHVPPVSQ